VRELRVVGTVALLGVAVYLVVVRRGSIEHALSRLGRAQPGWIAVAVAAEFASLVCYVALVRVLLQLGTVTVPLRALFSLTVIGIAMLNSIPGGQAISTIYWYEQLRRYSVRRSVAAFVQQPLRVLAVHATPEALAPARRVWPRTLRESRLRGATTRRSPVESVGLGGASRVI
jgi:uncharacterized membrane protein